MNPGRTEWRDTPIEDLLVHYPFVSDFFSGIGLQPDGGDQTISQWVHGLSEEELEDVGLERADILENLDGFMTAMVEMGNGEGFQLKSLIIRGGTDKSGNPEVDHVRLMPGNVISIVGPTGSGKSRLLADIEWMAQGDTPTGRTIYLNDQQPRPEWRFSPEHKLVAQLSQNMNFVMDLSAEEFVQLHAESRLIPHPERVVGRVLDQANQLAGESFMPDTPVTSLSGGQSRALMIADTAFLSQSPIVLIDEIENAGIDRKRALDLLVAKEKIVLIATHDPILALMADRRIVIRNGGIWRVLDTSNEEQAQRNQLERVDRMLLALRNDLRQGKRMIVDGVSGLCRVNKGGSDA